MVHGREVYIVGYTPRVNGYRPGSPSRSSRSAGWSAGPYTLWISKPDSLRVISADGRRRRGAVRASVRAVNSGSRYGDGRDRTFLNSRAARKIGEAAGIGGRRTIDRPLRRRFAAVTQLPTWHGEPVPPTGSSASAAAGREAGGRDTGRDTGGRDPGAGYEPAHEPSPWQQSAREHAERQGQLGQPGQRAAPGTLI